MSAQSTFKSYYRINDRWGRVTLLEALAKYRTADVKDAEHICERVVPQFQHQNASVVMAAIKVIMLNLNTVGVEMQRSLIKKMGPPLGMSSVIAN
jgi:AP-1 complex subunit beta-1